MEKELKEKIENNKYKLMDLWDLICSNVGFDKRGKEIQGDIRKFVELKVDQKKQKWGTKEFHRGWDNCEKFWGIKNNCAGKNKENQKLAEKIEKPTKVEWYKGGKQTLKNRRV